MELASGICESGPETTFEGPCEILVTCVGSERLADRRDDRAGTRKETRPALPERHIVLFTGFLYERNRIVT